MTGLDIFKLIFKIRIQSNGFPHGIMRKYILMHMGHYSLFSFVPLPPVFPGPFLVFSLFPFFPQLELFLLSNYLCSSAHSISHCREQVKSRASEVLSACALCEMRWRVKDQDLRLMGNQQSPSLRLRLRGMAEPSSGPSVNGGSVDACANANCSFLHPDVYSLRLLIYRELLPRLANSTCCCT